MAQTKMRAVWDDLCPEGGCYEIRCKLLAACRLQIKMGFVLFSFRYADFQEALQADHPCLTL